MREDLDYLPHKQARILAKLYRRCEAFDRWLQEREEQELADILEVQPVADEKLPTWAHQAALDEVERRLAKRESLQDYLGYDD